MKRVRCSRQRRSRVVRAAAPTAPVVVDLTRPLPVDPPHDTRVITCFPGHVDRPMWQRDATGGLRLPPVHLSHPAFVHARPLPLQRRERHCRWPAEGATHGLARPLPLAQRAQHGFFPRHTPGAGVGAHTLLRLHLDTHTQVLVSGKTCEITHAPCAMRAVHAVCARSDAGC